MGRKAGKRNANISAANDAVWRALTEYIDEFGFAPTLRELGERCFRGRSAVHFSLHRLHYFGKVEMLFGYSRAIRLLQRHPDVPLPVEREHESEDY